MCVCICVGRGLTQKASESAAQASPRSPCSAYFKQDAGWHVGWHPSYAVGCSGAWNPGEPSCIRESGITF